MVNTHKESTSGKPRRNKKKDPKCSFCSPSFVVLKRYQAIQGKLSTTREGIRCPRCHLFACKFCLEKVEAAIPTKDKDSWCGHVQKYLKDGEIDKNFVGHCCELMMMKNQIEDAEEVVPGLVEEVGTPLFDGDLFFPEFSLLVETTFKGGDVICVSPDRELGIPEAWHAVVSLDQAQVFRQNSVTPKEFPYGLFEEMTIHTRIP